MKKRTSLYVAIIIIVAAGAYLLVYGLPGSTAEHYEFVTVTRGDIENTVSATGTLSPVTTIEVGTQISGTIDSIFADFNDTIRAGQILVVLDTLLLKASVLDAEAGLERAEAQLAQAQADYDRNKSLFEKNLISDATWLPFAINLKSQNAAVKSARATLDRNRRNLELAVIRSPIDGIVIGRTVEAGQTVAASLSTPTLYVIAQDLARMEILADVDESDIGQIKVGQDVRFEVASYLNEKFTGSVTQIRLQPKTVSNVVTYTVVVEAANDRGLLLPGMTATVDFITARHTDVLLIPSRALRFQPSEKALAAYQARMEKNRPAKPDSASIATPGRPAAMRGQMRQRPSDAVTVWYLDSLGQLAAAPLRTCMTDGSNTEVIGSPVLNDGMRIISGVQNQTSTANVTQQRSPMGPGMRMRPF